ncbi:hypothetical protein DL769_010655 [Monosporascus sp. CRB-8-3]|nr:hypothetical protein DL769_010655 [Monosporascus sp. CRB-8-3]
MLKLRQLSLLTLAGDPQHGLGYAALLAALGLPDARSLEDLVISAVYADLLEAQLDPRNQTVHVSSVSPLRDLAPGSVPAILTQLRAWSGRCAETLSDLEAQIAAVRAGAAARHAERKARDAAQARLVEQASKAGAGNDSRQGGPGVHGRGQNHLLSRAVAQLRGGGHRGKRGSVEANVGEDDDDELMEIDDDDAYEEGEAGGSGSGGGGAGSSNGGGSAQGDGAAVVDRDYDEPGSDPKRARVKPLSSSSADRSSGNGGSVDSSGMAPDDVASSSADAERE